jgi:hypothetical protein
MNTGDIVGFSIMLFICGYIMPAYIVHNFLKEKIGTVPAKIIALTPGLNTALAYIILALFIIMSIASIFED